MHPVTTLRSPRSLEASAPTPLRPHAQLITQSLQQEPLCAVRAAIPPGKDSPRTFKEEEPLAGIGRGSSQQYLQRFQHQVDRCNALERIDRISNLPDEIAVVRRRYPEREQCIRYTQECESARDEDVIVDGDRDQ